MGYTGGEKEFPTYHSLGNHTEALQVDFDPLQVSFADIVDLFWQSHNPLRGVRSRQYMTAIWFHDESQAEVINGAKKAIERELDATVQTPVMPLNMFYLAEDYHQKYGLQNCLLMRFFKEMYPDFEDFNNSTAAARVNGFIGGNGSRELFKQESSSYGIPVDELKQFVRSQETSNGRARCSGDRCTIE